jgi:hypothetical protein
VVVEVVPQQTVPTLQLQLVVLAERVQSLRLMGQQQLAQEAEVVVLKPQTKQIVVLVVQAVEELVVQEQPLVQEA